jgi:alpha-tubulin suppressor-like RCC1 family protein
VCAVAVANFASCAVTGTGELYTWGDGNFGLPWHDDTAAIQLAPKRVRAIRDNSVVAVSLAWCHTIAVTREGGVFGWGAAE